jgi:DNA-directed RNA polymerase subunit RPC12/RpoP
MTAELKLTSDTSWVCPACESKNVIGACTNCKHTIWLSRKETGEDDYYIQCALCDEKFYRIVCAECKAKFDIAKVLPKPESHPWMKFFTYVVIFAGIMMFFGAAGVLGDEYKTLSEKLPTAFLLGTGGALAVWAGVYSLRVTREFTRLSELPSNKRAVAVITATIGGLLSSFVVIVLVMAYAALKAEAESNRRR